MLRLQKCILTQLLPSTSASTSPLHRLISAAAPAASPGPSFAVEDYLVSTCGLTRAQALKVSTKLSHLKSPANPDAVRSFLAGLGLSTADVAALVAKDPKFLCASVERTLAPVAVGLAGLGLSRPEIARLVSLAGEFFRGRSVASRLAYFLFLFGSYEDLLRVLKHSPNLLGCDLDRVIKPNVAFLRECGLGACDIVRLCNRVPWLLGNNPERVRAIVACAEGLGVPRGSGMFGQALQAVAFLSQEKITAKVEHLKKMFRWSDAEVGVAVSKAPAVLLKAKESLQRRSEFLISEVGLEPAYIAFRPAMLMYSLEGRIRPRYYVVKFLKENGLLDHDRDYYNTIVISEKVFMEKFICPHKKSAPHLAEDYAAACRGEMPARFISS
ncbi:uncharacterized protein [Aegilops tauschii subsp. strangulata]|uniref:mTERF domain-containing protein 1, mitochondrial n=3 Tax=Aegilops tauschii subsp. strangulata TaxID=200361 RepID=A0A453A4G8_AEGTS|nr:transcription termination factor MTERF15, mitochondrial-like [Aegilops tauschii subsp. strangulata]